MSLRMVSCVLMVSLLGELAFRPIDDADLEIAVRFREDSFIESFGDASRFSRDEYLDFLRRRKQWDSMSVVHVWLKDEIVGQIEVGPFKTEPSAGYVNLYYLAPAYRGRGISVSLDEFAAGFLRRKGFKKAYLSVSPTNRRAIAFYEKNGWVSVGARPEQPEVILMEKTL